MIDDKELQNQECKRAAPLKATLVTGLDQQMVVKLIAYHIKA
jgi:hypothetical protein